MGGEQDHKPADTKKDIYAESAAVQEADVLQHDEERRDAPQRLDAVKMHLMKPPGNGSFRSPHGPRPQKSAS